MANAVCIGGGSQDAWIGLTPEQIVEAFGYNFNTTDPLVSMYQSIAKQDNPYASGSKFAPGFLSFAEACMRTRTLLFCNTSPNDCSTQAHSSVAAGSGGMAIGEISNLGLTGVNVGTSLAGVSSAALGAVTAGAGAILGVIIGIFQQHAQAVARQASALCTLAPQYSSAIEQVDAAVFSGQATPAEGQAAILQLAAAFQQATASLAKPCNAFCMYAALVKCISDISPYYYQQGIQAGAKTTSINSPGVPSIPGIPTAYVPGTAIALTPSTFAPSATVASTPDLPGIAASTPVWMWVLIGLFVLYFLLDY